MSTPIRIDPLDWQSPIVDPDTGCPTMLFIRIWQEVQKLNRLVGMTDVDISDPTDGQVLTYSASLGKWIAA